MLTTSILCHMLIGPPGSGKTTLAHQLQQAIAHSQIVSTDRIRQDLYCDASIQGDWATIEAIVHTQIQAAIQAGQPVIYDATNAQRSWRMALIQSWAALDLTWVGWHLTTSLETCQQWNQQRDRAVPESIIITFFEALQSFPPDAAEGFAAIYQVDPTQSAIDLTAQLHTLARRPINRPNRTLPGDI